MPVEMLQIRRSTMTDPAAAVAAGSFQHDSQEPTVITQTQTTDISQVPLPPLAAELEALRRAETNSQDSQNLVNINTDTTTVQPTRNAGNDSSLATRS